MPTAVERIVRNLRIQSHSSETDRALLAAFADDGDESAFAEIVRRHGPLVLGVCRRTLGNVQDAEDAFQATFLVLARKAGSVPWRDSIKNWLHGVACRIALKARGRALRRKQKEQAAGTQQPIVTAPEEAWSELRGVLDEELQQLPAKYRSVLLLCYLEGKTRDEAAELLGWSLGSVKGYLERGRELLRTRLCKRGLTLSAALTAGLLSQTTVGAALQTATVQSAVHFVAGSAAHAVLAGSVLNLAQGALNAMMIAKIKSIAFVTMMLTVGTGAFWGVYQTDTTGAASVSVTQIARGQDAPAQFIAFQEKDGRKKSNAYFGLIKEIDLKIGTLTATSLRDGGPDEAKFSLGSKDLKIASTFGEAMKLTDLAVGMRVHLDLKELDVIAIAVENPNVPAFLNSIDAEKRTVEARAERKLANYNVAADAKITVAGKVVKLAEVPLDTRVFITLSLDKKMILAMNVNSKNLRDGERPKEGQPGAERRKDERPVDRSGSVPATIIDIDVAKNSMNLLIGRDGELAIKTVSLAKDLKAKVFFAEQPIKEISAAELTKPLQASVQLSEDKKTISALTIVAPTIRAAVKSVDAAGNKITLMTAERDEKTYDVYAAAVIRGIGREASKLAAVNAGMRVIVGLSQDRQRVIGIVVEQATRREGDR